MEEAIKILASYGVSEDKAGEVAFKVAQAINDMWELDDIEQVAEDIGIDLTNTQARKVLAEWRTLESCGNIDREGVEYAIDEVLRTEEAIERRAEEESHYEDEQ